MKLFLLTLLFTAQAYAQDATPTAAPANSSSVNRSRGNSFNPDLSLNALMLYQNSKQGAAQDSEDPNGLSLQEAEIILSSAVDPYWNLMAVIAIHREFERPIEIDGLGGATEGEIEGEYVVEPEELYADTTAIPHVNVRLGKFKTRFGRHNQYHTHAFPFIDAPLSQTALLGDEGLNDVGVSFSALIPASWYSEFILQAIRGDAEGVDYFARPGNDDVVPVGRFVNLWELSDAATIELGLSAATGKYLPTERTTLSAVDLTYKWRPVEGGKYRAFSATAELIRREQGEVGTGATTDSIGTALWAQYQFARTWWAQARMEWLKKEDPLLVEPVAHTNKWSALLGYVPSEFSAIRLQYSEADQFSATDLDRRVMLQFNYSIGAHPGHIY